MPRPGRNREVESDGPIQSSEPHVERSFGDVRSMEPWGFDLWYCLALPAAMVFLFFFGKRMIVSLFGAVMAYDVYAKYFGPKQAQANNVQAAPPAENVPHTGAFWRFITILEHLALSLMVFFVVVMGILTFCDVRFQTTHVQSLMNSTAYPLQAWIQMQSEKTRIQLLHEQLCSKVGGDVLEQIEVLMQSGYKVSGIPSTLKSLEEERNSLLAERDALLKKLSAQENINAELHRDNVTCHGKLNRYVDEKRLMANETREVNANVMELKRQVAAITSDKNDCNSNVMELKRQVVAFTSDKNDCDASLTKVDRQLSNCRKALADSKKCWL
jgi:hypothetical protein